MPLLYVASCIFIPAFEATGSASAVLRELLRFLERKPGAAITRELTLAELFAPVKRLPQNIAEARMPIYLEFFDKGSFVDPIPVSRSILMDTAIVRHRHSRRLPDAIHIATALALGCSFFMTFDSDAKRRPSTHRWVTATTGDLDAVIKALDA